MHRSETDTLRSVHSPPNGYQLALRHPCLNDAAAIYELIEQSPPLDLNSLYAYLLLTHHHAATCIVATAPNHPIHGFVSAYIPPATPTVLFVWQVAVHPVARGTGLAKQMLLSLLSRPELQAVQSIETTVSPDNLASRRMFASLARDLATEISESPLFEAPHFGKYQHAPERLLRIGPFETA